MRRLTVTLCLSIVVLLGSAGMSFALPECQSTYNLHNWSNCVGTKFYADGTKYVGEWSDGKRHGWGIRTTNYGYKYVGEFKDGNWHGQGTWSYIDGTVKEGIWGNGDFLYAKKPSVTSSPKVASNEKLTCSRANNICAFHHLVVQSLVLEDRHEYL